MISVAFASSWSGLRLQLDLDPRDAVGPDGNLPLELSVPLQFENDVGDAGRRETGQRPAQFLAVHENLGARRIGAYVDQRIPFLARRRRICRQARGDLGEDEQSTAIADKAIRFMAGFSFLGKGLPGPSIRVSFSRGLWNARRGPLAPGYGLGTGEPVRVIP